LLDAGHRQITAVRLDDTDIHEDRAAAVIADAMTGSHLRGSAARTGRANLFADKEGLFVFSREQILAANRIDPSITIAVLAENRWVSAGKMVATIKIIPYAVNAALLDDVISLLKSGSRLSIAHVVPSRVGLIQTTLPGTSESLLQKARAVTDVRLSKRQMSVAVESRVNHDEASLCREISRMTDTGVDHLLIVGASAISDLKDVIPQAISFAGGEVSRFGMAADPGNLLLVGSIGNRTILGLPGCARSPKYNGLDPVLDRIATGLPVTDDWLTSLAIGGLMDEMLDRPAPRMSAASRTGVAGVVLAAGSSSRAGSVNKLLHPVNDMAMVSHSAAAVCQSAVNEVAVITGFDAGVVERALHRDLPGSVFQLKRNGAFDTGMASSLRTAVSLFDQYDGLLVALGDMPFISPSIINQLIASFQSTPDKVIFIPTWQGKRGNPVLLGHELFDTLLDNEGDVGARTLIDDYPELVELVAVDTDDILRDFDTIAELDQLSQRKFKAR